MYSTTDEYRVFFRKICGMDAAKMYSNAEMDPAAADEPLDAETLDEFTYDESAVSAFLAKVYEFTYRSPQFMHLYMNAAALMISIDPEIGMTVLMSYDYLADFYACMTDYAARPAEFGESNAHYRALIGKIGHR